MGRRCLVLLALVAGALVLPPTVTANHPPEPTSRNMLHLGNSKDLTEPATNSDLAFWGNLVYAGNYNGFRIIDASNPSNPRELSNVLCRGPQNDVGVWGNEKRRLLFLSVDSRQREERCSGDDPTRTTGWEGLRIFDVTKPRRPVFVKGVATDCGSHTHTVIPVSKSGNRYTIDAENANRVLVYVSSYPLTGQGVHVDEGIPGPQDPFDGTLSKCLNDHNQISIVDVPLNAPENATVKRQPLDADTRGAGVVPVRGCHDIQAFLELKLAAASCLGEGQIWDISDPYNPGTTDPDGHTHVRNEFPVGPASPNLSSIWHSAEFTWDGRYVVFNDEWSGAAAPGCQGLLDRTGNGWIYRVRRPSQPVEGPLGRFMIDRPQTTEECTIHNGNFIPTRQGYFSPMAWYKAGQNVIDWTNPFAPAEAGYFEAQNADGNGRDDVWSSYWYRDLVFSNGGLGRHGSAANDRGLDIYRFLHPATGDAERFDHMNPQTQEKLLGGSEDDDD